MKRRNIGLLLLLVMLLASACGRTEKPVVPAEGEYAVYYLDKTATQLYPVFYMAESVPEDTKSLTAELLEQFFHVPSDTDAVPAVWEQTEYRGFRMDDTVLYVYFDETCGDMKKERLILFCAALTKTLCQVPGVEHVGVYAGEHMLMNKDGTPLGPFAANDFMDSISNVNSYETTELILYFADQEGKVLRRETRSVFYRVDTPLEELVVEQLLAGPQRSGSRAVFSAGTRLLSLSVNENICYLNFNREFLTAIPDEDPYLTIYALVNSLTELDSVQRVQIAVEGSQDVMLRDAIPLDTLFEADPDYLEN